MVDIGWWVGAAGTLIGIAIGAAGVIYGRRQAIAQEGPKEPTLSLHDMGWEQEDWLHLAILTNNKTDSRWEMISAQLTIPVGGKLFSIHERPRTGPDYDPTLTPLPEINVEKMTNLARPLSKVAPAGTRSDHNFYGSNDACREDFYAYIPARLRAESISIVFTLEDNALTARQRSTTLNRRLPDRIAKQIP